MTRATLAVAAAALVLFAAPGGALADGDPASDVLLGQDVFLPYSPVSSALASRLYALTGAAAAHGYPLRVALIGARSDLGVVPALFGKPTAYARFLSAELGGAAPGPVLVVMPQGFGLAAGGRALATTAAAGIATAGGADGLASAALAAIPRLARAAGHPLPVGAGAAAASTAGAGAGTIRHALIAVGVMALLASAGIGQALRARQRRG